MRFTRDLFRGTSPLLAALAVPPLGRGDGNSTEKRISGGIFFLFLSLLLFTACDKPNIPTEYVLDLPANFPPPAIPVDNPMTEEKFNLGKKLFFDPQLSADGTVSCASCHFQAFGFSDTTALSEGVEGRLGRRNAMPIINLAYASKLFWDGGVNSLEDQALHPIIDELEMDADPAEILTYLLEDGEYLDLFDLAYNARPTIAGVVDAIATYERALISSNSPYDQYVLGNENAISPAAKRGLELFNSESAECFHCHTGYNFTDNSFQNNGLYEMYADEGRAEITGRESDAGKFKTPTLRNIAKTAPYMHDGSLATLEAVLDHYASQGKNHPNRSIFLFNISLSEQDKQDIIAFLESLTDEEFLSNPAFRP